MTIYATGTQQLIIAVVESIATLVGSLSKRARTVPPVQVEWDG